MAGTETAPGSAPAIALAGSQAILVADIGGTNARFAVSSASGDTRRMLSLRSSDYGSLTEAAKVYLQNVPDEERPRVGAFAVASPVVGDAIKLTNRRWSFSIEELRVELGLQTLDVINDFTATALSLPELGPNDVRPLGGPLKTDGEDSRGERRALGVIGPGTGLGVSGLIPVPRPTGDGWAPMASEGGHVTMPATTDRDRALIGTIWKRFDHVSAERVVSGQGLVNLHRAITDLDDLPSEQIKPADITRRAHDGTCPICIEVIAVFTRCLGALAGDLCLTLGAVGGIYIAGGIVPKLGSSFDVEAFREAFVAKGRFREYLESVPTRLITRDVPAFLGLAALARGRVASGVEATDA